MNSQFHSAAVIIAKSIGAAMKHGGGGIRVSTQLSRPAGSGSKTTHRGAARKICPQITNARQSGNCRRRQITRVGAAMVWRSVKVDGILSDVANLSRSKDNVMARAVREVAWNPANDPPKMRH
jgi:hypothetical protein